MSSCKSYLEAMSKMGVLVGDFYLLLGHEFNPAALPASLAAGPMKQCYANASNLALEHPHYAYCEGFALREGLFPMHHAWCVTEAGDVIDPTWPDANKNEYFGVALSDQFLLEQLEQTGTWGLLAERIPPALIARHPSTFLHPQWLPPLPQLDAFAQKMRAAGGR